MRFVIVRAFPDDVKGPVIGTYVLTWEFV